MWSGNMEWTHPEMGNVVMIPEQRRAHTAVVYKHYMYIYGGFLDLFGSSGQLWIFDLGRHLVIWMHS